MSRNRSSVWKHFEKLFEDKASCNYCSNLFSTKGGSTTNLFRHIRTKHPTIILNLSATTTMTEETMSTVSNPSPTTTMTEETIPTLYIKTPQDEESQTVASQADNTASEGDQQEQDPLFSSPSRSSIIPPAKKQRVVGPTDKEEELLSLACKFLKEPKAPETNCPTIIKVWGEKLKVLDPKQRLFAEKAINDVLFEASLGNLHRYSVKINEDPYNRQSVQSFTLTPYPQQYSPEDKL